MGRCSLRAPALCWARPANRTCCSSSRTVRRPRLSRHRACGRLTRAPRLLRRPPARARRVWRQGDHAARRQARVFTGRRCIRAQLCAAGNLLSDEELVPYRPPAGYHEGLGPPYTLPGFGRRLYNPPAVFPSEWLVCHGNGQGSLHSRCPCCRATVHCADGCADLTQESGADRYSIQ